MCSLHVCLCEGVWHRRVRVYPTSSANYRPMISSAVTTTLFLHVNDSQMGPHILPLAHTMLSLKASEMGIKPKERKRRMPLLFPAGVGWMAKGTESCPWNNNHSHSYPQILLLLLSPLVRSSSSSPRLNLSTFMGMCTQALSLGLRLASASFCVCQHSDEGEKRNGRVCL